MSRITKKAWKDAATLIIAGKNGNLSSTFDKLKESGTRLSCGKSSSSIKFHGLPKKLGFDNNISNVDSDFDILLLKRSSSSSFMPDAYVFPGGVIDQSDYSGDWSDIFSSAGFHEDALRIYKNVPVQRPPLFDDYNDSVLGPDVAFRICALRETFEESGVLIMKSADGSKFAGLSHAENLDWRRRVHENASTFLVMCRQLNCVPDIWSLTEWSNWLTPVSMKRRYDTIFYLCHLDYQPHIEQDNKETTHAQWSQPLSMLQDHIAEKLWIAPPQAYELTRLTRYRSLKDLAVFAEEREPHGTERWLPFRYACKNGLVSVLPGDDRFPPDPEKEAKKKDNSLPDAKTKMLNNLNPRSFEAMTGKTLEEFKAGSSHVNRIEMISSSHYKITSNCERLGHPPLNFEADKQTGNIVRTNRPKL